MTTTSRKPTEASDMQPISKQLAGLLGRLLLACAFLAVMTNMIYQALAMTLVGIVLVWYAAPIKQRKEQP